MYSKFQLAKKYIQYWLRASNGKGHGVHSPFVFELITGVLNDDRNYYCYKPIERLRAELKVNSTLLTIEDFGAGSRVAAHQQRKVSAIANSALKPKKFGQLLFRIVNFYQPKNILELGTSLGITTAYLASGKADAKVITMEGASAVAAVAKSNFSKLGVTNITMVEGNFDYNLATVIGTHMPAVNLAFIDGNHRKLPTLQYFQQLLHVTDEYSVLIFDDIHWSEEMEQAWQQIQSHEAVTVTVDLFFIGLVFFRQENKIKQHFSIRF